MKRLLKTSLVFALLALSLLFIAPRAPAQVNNFNILDGSSPPPPPVAITVTASPFVYTNSAGMKGTVVLSGGTVSLIEIQRPPAGFLVEGETSGQFFLAPGDQVRVTYSVVPTMTFFGTP